jgi:ABC-type dipeptide/oligopeptide/nickel transport system ATPase subunit
MAEREERFEGFREMIPFLPPILAIRVEKIVEQFDSLGAVQKIKESFALLEETLALSTIIGIGVYSDKSVRKKLSKSDIKIIDDQLEKLTRPSLGQWRGSFRILYNKLGSVALNPWRVDLLCKLKSENILFFFNAVKQAISFIKVETREKNLNLDKFLDLAVEIRNQDEHQRMTDEMKQAICDSLTLAVLQFLMEIDVFRFASLFYISGKKRSEKAGEYEYSGIILRHKSLPTPANIHSDKDCKEDKICLADTESGEILLNQIFPLLDFIDDKNLLYVFRGFRKNIVSQFCFNATPEMANRSVELDESEMEEIPIIRIFGNYEILLKEFDGKYLTDYFIKEKNRFQRKFRETPYLPLNTIQTFNREPSGVLSQFTTLNERPAEIPIEPLNVLELFNQDMTKGILIMGSAGCGKTTLLYKLIDTLATDHEKRLQGQNHDKESWSTIPLFFELRNYGGQSIAELIADLAYQSINPHHCENINDIILEKLKQGQFILMLDSLDEIPSIHRETFCHEISHFPVELSQCKLLFTSREIPFPDNSVLERIQRTILVGQLAVDNINKYLKKLTPYSSIDEISSQIGKDKETILQLCYYPQGLEMFSSVFRFGRASGEFPDDMFTLYKYSIENLRDVLLQQVQEDFLQKFLKDDKAFYFSHIQWAFRLLSQNAYSIGKNKGEKILDEITSFLKKPEEDEIEFKNRIIRALFHDIRLLEETAGRYSFVLRSCADFFTSFRFLQVFTDTDSQSDQLKVIEKEMQQSSLLNEPFIEAILQHMKGMKDDQARMEILTVKFLNYDWAKQLLPRILHKINQYKTESSWLFVRRVIDCWSEQGDNATVYNCALEVMYSKPLIKLLGNKNVQQAQSAADAIYLLLHRMALQKKYQDFELLVTELLDKFSFSGVLKLKKRLTWLVMTIWRIYMTMDDDQHAKEIIVKSLAAPMRRLYFILSIFPIWIIRPVLSFARSRFNRIHSEGTFEQIFHVPNIQEYESFKAALNYLGKVTAGMEKSLSVLKNFGEVGRQDSMWQLKRGLYGSLLYTLVHHDFQYLFQNYFQRIKQFSNEEMSPKTQEKVNGVRDMIIRCFGYYARETDISEKNINQHGAYYQLLNELMTQQLVKYRADFVELYTMVGRPKNYLYAIGVLEAKVYGELFFIKKLILSAKEENDLIVLRKCFFDLLPIGLDYPLPVMKCIQDTIDFNHDSFLLRALAVKFDPQKELTPDQNVFIVLASLLKGLSIYHQELVDQFVNKMGGAELQAQIEINTKAEFVKKAFTRFNTDAKKIKIRFESVEDIVFTYSDELKSSLFINQLMTLNNHSDDDNFVRSTFHLFWNELLDYQHKNNFAPLSTGDIFKIIKKWLKKTKKHVKKIISQN